LAHIVTWAPPSARILPNVVPQLPAPMTATRGPAGAAGVLRVKAPGLLLPVVGRIPPYRRRLLAANVFEQRGDRVHQARGGLGEGRLVAGTAAQVRQVDRVAHDHLHPAARRPETDALLVAAHDLLRAPLRHR